MRNLKLKFIIFWSKLYRVYLKYKLVRFFLWTGLFVWTLLGHSVFLSLLKLLILLIYRHFFIFPVRHGKVVNTVLGPPGSGKTSLMAFISLKTSYLNVPVYSNVPIKGTFKFDWECDFGTYQIEDSMIIVDEAGLELDNRQFAQHFTDIVDKKTGKLIHNGRSKLVTAKLHRHYGLTLWFCSQGSQGDFDLKLRSLTQNFWLCKKTGVPWLLKVQLYDTDVNVDPMTADFRVERRKLHTYFIFSPVIWLSFDTEDAPILPYKEFEKYGNSKI